MTNWFHEASGKLIKRTLNAGCDYVNSYANICINDDGDFQMTGRTGTHVISGNSSNERLGAHWCGFIENNRRAACTTREVK